MEPETLKMVKSFKNHLLKFKKTAGLDFYDRSGLYALEVAKGLRADGA